MELTVKMDYQDEWDQRDLLEPLEILGEMEVTELQEQKEMLELQDYPVVAVSLVCLDKEQKVSPVGPEW